jgi:hypothetical protein
MRPRGGGGLSCCSLRPVRGSLGARCSPIRGLALSRDLCEDLFPRVRGRFIPEGLQSARATARIQYEYGPSSERGVTAG